jgi:ribosomal protein S18 acetylase RimI-like enzyme
MLESGSYVSVRNGRASDAAQLASVFRESWLLAYQGVIPPLHLESMVRRRGVEWWKTAMRAGDMTLVIEAGGKVVGYASCGQARSRGPYEGEIYELYVDPVHQGLGFGERLFEGARHALDQKNLDGLLVWALSENEAACHFYWRRGGRPVARTFDRIGAKKLEKIAFAWD